MVDYYDGSPLLHLRRPVVLISVLTELTRDVAYRVSALSGTTFHDIDRKVEHEAGRGLALYVLEEGEAVYRALEARCLERAIRERPAGIVALGDGGLLSPESRAVVDAGADLVVLELDLTGLFWRIQTLGRQRGWTSWSPRPGELPQKPEELRGYFEPRRSSMSGATRRLEAHGRRSADLGNAVLAWLESLEPDESGPRRDT